MSPEKLRSEPLEGLRILRGPEVYRLVPIAKTRIAVLEKAGRFPKRVRLSGNAVGWFEADIREWLLQRAIDRAVAQPPAPQPAAPVGPVKALRSGNSKGGA